jgi:transposase-like protein
MSANRFFRRVFFAYRTVCPQTPLTARRDAGAALRFFHKAIRHQAEPEVITIDKSGANMATLTTLSAGKSADGSIRVRQSKYLNNLIQHDHRNIKRRTRLMTGIKSFRRAQAIWQVLRWFTGCARDIINIRKVMDYPRQNHFIC